MKRRDTVIWWVCNKLLGLASPWYQNHLRDAFDYYYGSDDWQYE